jgi:hypothetical protein
MAGLDPAIHVFAVKPKIKDVDGPIKSGHDDVGKRLFKQPPRSVFITAIKKGVPWDALFI